jgi:hypothetical protein
MMMMMMMMNQMNKIFQKDILNIGDQVSSENKPKIIESGHRQLNSLKKIINIKPKYFEVSIFVALFFELMIIELLGLLHSSN